ncbi:MAG: type III polyketide synthase [Aestuariivirgaceae bacterium]
MSVCAHASGSRPLLKSLANAVPDHLLAQGDVVHAVTDLFSPRMSNFEKLTPIFKNAGIDRRYSACPAEWYKQSRNWRERNDIYIAVSEKLFEDAAGKALADAQMVAEQIDMIVTVSSTGIATPTIEARQMHAMGFRETVHRVPVFGLGCAGGVTGLALASRLAAAEPGSNVLLVVIELCTLSFQYDELSKSNIVASALFGDGAAAAVISTKSTNPLGYVEHSGEHTWPDTLSIMGWQVDSRGLGVIFDRSIPDLVKGHMRSATLNFLERHQLSLNDIGGFAFHPGGAKVLDALEAAFELRQGELNKEREILRDFGNMSAPTVLFVLARALKQTQGARHLVSALGPGFTASYATLVN